MSNSMNPVQTHWTRVASFAVCLVALISCNKGGGESVDPTGVGPGGTSAPIEWGNIPPDPRLPGALPSTDFLPEFSVQNHGLGRTETVSASVPFPWSFVHESDLNEYSVAGQDTAWHILQRWPDNSVRVAQAQFTTTIGPGQTVHYQVVREPASIRGDFSPHPVFANGLPSFGAELHDTLGVHYRAFWHSPSEVVQESPLVRVRRVRAYHRPISGTGMGRDFLSSTFYLTEYAHQPVILVDWVLGNDYLGADDPRGSNDPNLYPLGAIDVEYAAFLARDADLVMPYRPTEEG
ncbi:MAG: hypothetical protein VYE77_05155, partial [Planctomycetota bacterium]|nr:hypothetical protein [Planctomycetota bacterium]